VSDPARTDAPRGSPADPAAGVRPLLVLLLAAAALFSANARSIGLPAIDDCFYARKGVEMARGGPSFTVTWGGEPAFQNPPLAIWALAGSFRLLGENDLAARAPSLLMALAIMAGVWRLGSLASGPAAGAGGAALLLLTPGFTNQARRCMLEIPLTFWVTAAMVVLADGRRHPRLLALVALPLAGGILTKSVLGLLPLALAAAACAVSPAWRGTLGRRGFLAGVAAGLVLGATWPLHQWLTFGPEALRAHYVAEIGERAARGFSLSGLLFHYPRILLTLYQPVVLPAVVGAFFLWRRRREPGGDVAVLLVLWAFLPVALYSLSATRSTRYVYPVLPALALCAADGLARALPRLNAAVFRWVAPLAACALAIVFWVRPSALTGTARPLLKVDRQIERRVPEGESVAYLGAPEPYWRIANPLLYYQERMLSAPSPTAREAVDEARQSRSGLLVVEERRLAELGALAGAPVLVDGGDWRVLDLSPAGEDAAGENDRPRRP
jgi:4-amino-4-deoxy-L-arabinose transferase-like glycosyltransferase